MADPPPPPLPHPVDDPVPDPGPLEADVPAPDPPVPPPAGDPVPDAAAPGAQGLEGEDPGSGVRRRAGAARPIYSAAAVLRGGRLGTAVITREALLFVTA
jgi:hypothetical protein